MPISVDERDNLRSLVTFTTDELAAAGDPDNALKSLQALTEQRLLEYQTTVDTERQAVLALIDADPTGTVHAFWQAAQDGVWARLNAQMTTEQLAMLFTNVDVRIKQLAKSLPLLASLRWTLANFQAG